MEITCLKRNGNFCSLKDSSDSLDFIMWIHMFHVDLQQQQLNLLYDQGEILIHLPCSCCSFPDSNEVLKKLLSVGLENDGGT